MKKTVGVWICFLALMAVPTLSRAECWRSLGTVQEYTAQQQCSQLKTMLKELVIDPKQKCDLFAFSWQISTPEEDEIYTYVLFDGTIGDIYRVQVTMWKKGGRGVKWEMWNNVSKALIMGKDPAEGLGFKNYTHGSGLIPLMLEAKEFVDNYSPVPEFRNTAF